MLRHILLIIAMAALSMAFLAACNDADDDTAPVEGDDDELGLADDPTPEGEEPDEGAARTDEGDAAGQTGGSPQDDEADLLADSTDVTLIDHEIEMETTTIDEGLASFSISNEGDHEHGISIIPEESDTGESVDDQDDILGTMYVDPEDEEQLELDLPEGEYVVFCPVNDHREEYGMETTLTVEGSE